MPKLTPPILLTCVLSWLQLADVYRFDGHGFLYCATSIQKFPFNVIREATTFNNMLAYLSIVLLMFLHPSGTMTACLLNLDRSTSTIFNLIYHVGFQVSIEKFRVMNTTCCVSWTLYCRKRLVYHEIQFGFLKFLCCFSQLFFTASYHLL